MLKFIDDNAGRTDAQKELAVKWNAELDASRKHKTTQWICTALSVFSIFVIMGLTGYVTRDLSPAKGTLWATLMAIPSFIVAVLFDAIPGKAPKSSLIAGEKGIDSTTAMDDSYRELVETVKPDWMQLSGSLLMALIDSDEVIEVDYARGLAVLEKLGELSKVNPPAGVDHSRLSDKADEAMCRELGLLDKAIELKANAARAAIDKANREAEDLKRRDEESKRKLAAILDGEGPVISADMKAMLDERAKLDSISMSLSTKNNNTTPAKRS